MTFEPIVPSIRFCRRGRWGYIVGRDADGDYVIHFDDGGEGRLDPDADATLVRKAPH